MFARLGQRLLTGIAVVLGVVFVVGRVGVGGSVRTNDSRTSAGVEPRRPALAEGTPQDQAVDDLVHFFLRLLVDG